MLSTDITLSEPVLLILSALAPAPRHGYGLLKDVEVLSQGRLRLSTGTLYGALRRLLEQGWIERHQERAGRDRQEYRLTGLGRTALTREAQRLQALSETLRGQLAAVPEPEPAS